ncbi:MAG: hypothetical protein LBJ60_02055 [Tannerellaceae bacterium]|jgi:hypothetical protein|nr:hypothetical protein [Tannerellaceae bacterium]
MKMVKIIRWWPVNINFELLYKRPRVDYRISEYIFEYITQNIFIPYNINEIENYNVVLAFDTYDIKRHRYYFPYKSPYNTDTTKYASMEINKENNGKKYFKIHIDCCSTELDENTKSIDYANIVYNMFGDYIVKHFKKTIKEIKQIVDTTKKGMDYELIGSFEHPSPFINQKYLYDNECGLEEISIDGFINGIIRPGNIPMNIKEEYIKYYE